MGISQKKVYKNFCFPGKQTSQSSNSSEPLKVCPVEVKEIWPGSPLKSCLSIGDQIISVDGTDVASLSLPEIVFLLAKIERTKAKDSSVEIVFQTKRSFDSSANFCSLDF